MAIDNENDDAEKEGWTAKNSFRKSIAFLFSHIGLTALVVGYSIMGAFLFKHLEHDHEISQMGVIKEWKNDAVFDIWNITNEVHVRELYQVKTKNC